MGRRQKPANWFLEIHLVESWSRNTSLIASYFCFTSFSEGIQGLLTNCFQGRKQNPGIQTYLLGIHMYSVRRKKKSAGIQYSKQNPFLKKVSMAFHCPGLGWGAEKILGSSRSAWCGHTVLICLSWAFSDAATLHSNSTGRGSSGPHCLHTGFSFCLTYSYSQDEEGACV